MKKKSKSATFASSWIIFWEGALIAHFFGLKWCAIWCGVCFIFSLGIRLGVAIAKKTR